MWRICGRITCFFIVAFTANEGASAQAFGFGTGWYSGITSESLEASLADTTATVSIDRRIPLLIEFYSRSFFDNETRDRFGLRLHIYGATNRLDSLQESNGGAEAESFGMTSILLSYQHLLSEPGEGYFIFDLAGGFSIFSSEAEAERRFCLVPGLAQVFRLSSHLGLQTGMRLHVIFGDSQRIAPFKSGLLLNVGITMEN